MYKNEQKPEKSINKCGEFSCRQTMYKHVETTCSWRRPVDSIYDDDEDKNYRNATNSALEFRLYRK